MKIRLRAIFSTAAILVLAQWAPAQVPQFSPFSADMQMTSTHSEAGPRDFTGKVFVGSGHLRLNMDAGGHQSVIITDFATKVTDILMVEQKMYFEHKAGQMPRRGPGGITEDLKPFDPANPCANQPDLTCKKIGVEQVSGRTCDHWEVTDKQGKVSNVWIDEKLRFPVKVTTEDSTLLLSNIKEGAPAASLFQIPADFNKVDMHGMPQQPKN